MFSTSAHPSMCLVWGAIGDAYAKAHEFTRGVPNDLVYRPHPKHGATGKYTDDTQQALAIAEHVIAGSPWSAVAVADRLVAAYHRDRRGGYSSRMERLLGGSRNGSDLIAKIVVGRPSSGAVMRVWPIGAMQSIALVNECAEIQALATHPKEAAKAAQVVAGCFHFFARLGGERADVKDFVSSTYGLSFTPGKFVENDANSVTAWYLEMMGSGPKDCDELLKACVDVGGDVDTLASLVMASCCACPGKHKLPQSLFDGLENNDFGRDYLAAIGVSLAAGRERNS